MIVQLPSMLKIKSGSLLLTLALFITMHFAWGQSRTITGKVTGSDTGEPLPGVNILIKGTTRGTITDYNGNYSLEVQPDDETLIFSYVGYTDQEITIGTQTTIDVVLQVSSVGLQEVVVIGYGTVKKSDLTGAVSSVRGRDLTKIPSSNPIQALQGKVAGVQVASSSGEPGEKPVVRVRGVGTLNNADPIYVVDGVILDDISFLNTNDIYSIELLKDASATAIYGSRGANGVFIITTKQGGINTESQINLKSEFSVQRLQKKIDVLNGREFAEALNDISPGTINNIDAVPNIDWQDEVFDQNAPIQSYDVSASGGGDKINFYIGGGVFNQSGIIPKSNYKRYNLKLNTQYKPKDYLTLGANISAAHIDNDGAPNVVITAYRAWPIDEPYDNNGNFKEVRGTGNPLAAIAYTNNNTKQYRLVSNLFAKIQFLNDFTLKTSYQLDYLTSKNRNFTPEYFVSATQQNPRSKLSIDFTEDRTWIWENTLTYYKEINKHRINAVLGYTMQDHYYESPNITVNRLVRENPDFWYFNAAITDTVDISNNIGDVYKNSIMSYLFRTNYTYGDRYLFTFSLRADGSSKFSKDKRFGYFPSLAVGWNITNETFWPGNLPIDNLKIRGSWGIIGNEKINWFDRYSLIGSQLGAVFGSPEGLQPGATYTGAGNNDLIWESTYQSNIGLEGGAFSDRLVFDLDYYNKKTKDILVLLDVPGYYGFGSFQQVRFNAATVVNKGLEFNLTWREKRGDFNYQFNVLGTTVHNEVISLGSTTPSDSVIYSGGLSNGKRVTATTAGYPIGSFIGYKTQGIFQNTEDLNNHPHLITQGVGDLIYQDTNGDGNLNPADRVILGSPIPDFIYGFGMQFGYKGLNLSLDFQGQTGNDIYNGKNQTRFSIYNFEGRVRNRWTGPGTSNTEPGLDNLAGNYDESDYYIEKGDFLRLRTILLSYDLPDKWIEKAGFKDVSVYVRGTNVFTLTGYSGYSPEIGGEPLSAGIDQGIYPITSVYSVGLNLSF